MEDKKYAIELEVITPLSVGAGNDNEWMRGIDYVQKDGKVYVLDIKKAVEQGIDIDRLTSLFERTDENGISLLIGNKLESVSSLVFDAPVPTTNSIKTFLRTQLYGKPVVAGSSIKGSVRSALFHYLRDNDRTNEEVFGNMKEGTDLMRFIRITDIEMPSTSLVNTKIFNLRKDGSEWLGGWKHAMNETSREYRPNGFNTLYECVLPGRKGLGAISLAGNAFELMVANTDKIISHNSKKQQLLSGDIKGLFNILNQVTKGYLQKEKAFFEKYPAERSDELIENINSLLEMIPDDDSYCLMKMSVGVGFHSITGDWQYDDYSKDNAHTVKKHGELISIPYKSRKTAEYKGKIRLMGFVKLRALNENEANQKAMSLDSEHANLIEGILEPARLREEELQRKREAEIQRKQAAEEGNRKQAVFLQLMEQAQQFYRNGQWDEAILKAEAAKEIYPDKTDATSLVDACKKAKEIEAYRQEEHAAAAQRFSQPLADVIKGKTSAGNLIGTTAKWLKSEGNSFGETEFHALLSEVKNLSPKEQKNINGKKKDLMKAIGEEWTEKLLGNL